MIAIEAQNIEYKQQLIDDLEQEVIALLNYHKGDGIYWNGGKK